MKGHHDPSNSYTREHLIEAWLQSVSPWSSWQEADRHGAGAVAGKFCILIYRQKEVTGPTVGF